MSRAPASRVARSLREYTQRAHAALPTGKAVFGTVLDTNPWTVEPHGAAQVLDEDDLTLSRWVEQYHYWAGVEEDDTVVLVEMDDGDYLVVDVVTDADPFDVGSGTGVPADVTQATANAFLIKSKVTGDSNSRWVARTDGGLEWGPGSGAQDVTLRRADSGVLAVRNLADNAYATIRAATPSDPADLVTKAYADSLITTGLVPGAGLSLTGTTLDVNVDNSTLEVATDTLQVKGGGIGGSHIVSGAISATHISAGAVGNTQLDTGAVTAAKITGGTITATEIANTTITAAKIANGTITDTQVAAANKDGTAGTASMRTLGTGATQAAQGNLVVPYAGATADVDLGAHALIVSAAVTNGAIQAHQPLGQILLVNTVVGDTSPSFKISGGGVLEWGPGGAASMDAELYRTVAGGLATDAEFSIGSLAHLLGGGAKFGTGGVGGTEDVQLKREAVDVLATRNGADNAYAILRAAAPVGDDDVATKRFVDGRRTFAFFMGG